MKNRLLVIALLLFGLTAFAASHRTFSFVNPQVTTLTIPESTTAYNIGLSGATTNATGFTYVNYAGTTYVTGTNTAVDSINFFGSVPFWDSGPWVRAGDTLSAGQTNLATGVISIKLVGGATSTNLVNFVFAPVFDSAQGATTARWTVAVTPTTTTSATVASALPLSVFGGAKAISLISVANTTTNATGDITISGISFNGYAP